MDDMSSSAKNEVKYEEPLDVEDQLPDENRLTEDVLNGSKAHEDFHAGELPIGSIQDSVFRRHNVDGRIDRFGTEIITRYDRLKNNLKSAHKVTYLDQVHNQANQGQTEDKKAKKLMTLD